MPECDSPSFRHHTGNYKATEASCSSPDQNGEWKKCQLLRVIFLSLFYYYQYQVFVCSSYTSLTKIYSRCLWIHQINYIQTSPGYHSLPFSLGNRSVQTNTFLLTKLFSKFLSERFSLTRRNKFLAYNKGLDSMLWMFFFNQTISRNILTSQYVISLDRCGEEYWGTVWGSIFSSDCKVYLDKIA